MVRANRRGRPVKDGPRYNCGRLKPQERPRDAGIWYRIRDEGDAFGLDPLHKSQLSRLARLGELTDRQAEAGFQLAQVYARYRRLNALRATPKSQSYTRSSAGEGPDLQGEELQRYEKQWRRAFKRWKEIQDCYGVLPTPTAMIRARELTERLCVLDLSLTSAELEVVAPMLDYVAQVLQIPGAPPVQLGKSIAIGRRRPGAKAQHSARTPIGKASFQDMLRTENPDREYLSAELHAKWLEFQARVDREKGQARKLAAGRRR